MLKKLISWKILLIIIVALGLGFYDLPSETQQKILPFLPEEYTNTKINLGLDLQGGSQLDYKIDLRKVPDEDQQDIIDGVLNVIEKRVNGLGVAEPNIYVSEIAEEFHITVELAETAVISQEDVETYLGADKKVGELTDDEQKLVSLEKAKATVGKTIQLEFKERKDTLDPQETEKVKEDAASALARINAGDEFSLVGLEEQQAFPGKVTYEKSTYMFAEEIPVKIKDTVLTLGVGEFTKDLIDTGGTFIIDESGNPIENVGLGLIKLADTSEEIKNEKEIFVSHILVSTESRTEDEAYDIIKDIEKQLNGGADFGALARENSEDPSNAASGGKLLKPVTGDGTYAYDFEEASLSFKAVGDVSEITKTQFGYHLIKADEIAENVKYTKYQYETLTYSTIPDPWEDTGLTGKHFVHADIQLDQYYQPYVLINFNSEGAKLFEEITERNIDKRVAIFVGGNLVSSPRVNEVIAGGTAQITGQFTSEEARTLARDLNTGAIPAPIILTGEYTIGATLGQEALSDSLYAGLIGLLLVMVFMVWNYRLAGVIATVALSVYATILLFLIKSQLHLGVSLFLALIMFGFLVVKIVNNKDSGWEKMLSFILGCFAFFFLAFILKTGVVLTLAGVAGIILSIGMAVDANILIFERFKEELKSGKSYGAALESGFNRAWSAIRDSNFSTLLTCAILFYFGSSIIKGFAFNLAAGVLVSMFTAITVTKTLLSGFIGKKISQNIKAFGANPSSTQGNFNFTGRSKTWLSISGILVIASIVSISIFGLKLGIDFKGGTLLEFKFAEPIEKELLASTFVDIEDEMNSSGVAPVEREPLESSIDETVLKQDESGLVDLTNIKILESGETSWVVKTKYLTSANHDEVLTKMKDRLPEFTEPRFTTIGPTIGSTLLHKALIAIVVSLLMIIVYIGFAFRKIPKEVNPWRFGVTAIVALLHDVIIVTGVFSVLSIFLNVEIDALFITAMLTVFGYSVNDTIVIFDRLRENLIKDEGHSSVGKIINKSLNQTIKRSINTSVSTLIVLISVLIWGSPTIFYFVLALTIGTFIGTYSSIFLAGPFLLKWNKWARRQTRSETERPN